MSRKNHRTDTYHGNIAHTGTQHSIRSEDRPGTANRIQAYSSKSEREEIKVIAQAKPVGGGPYMKSSRAGTLCDKLDCAQILEELNDLLGTSYTLDHTHSLRSLIDHCLKSYHDLGMVYAILRPHWDNPTLFPQLIQKLETWEMADTQMRIKALKNVGRKGREWIENERPLPPRRVWDLYSNRVVPFWVLRGDRAMDSGGWVGVSHSWMDAGFRKPVITSINSRNWPVPIPSDTDLERIRVELIYYGAEYAWLDVLCLRQEDAGSPENERLRGLEWRTDVPTICNVYSDYLPVVFYFSGLGRPFHIGDLSSPRHWLNRAWTLQEMTNSRTVAGIARDSPVEVLNLQPEFRNTKFEDKDKRTLHQKLIELVDRHSARDRNVFRFLSEMTRRNATNELDKIAGLGSLLGANPLPIYDSESHKDDEVLQANEAWMRLVVVMDASYRAQIFSQYPDAGSELLTWCPSWSQVANSQLSQKGTSNGFHVEFDNKKDTYHVKAWKFDNCSLRGLSEPFGERKGRLHHDRWDGHSHTLFVSASDRHCIPDGTYTMLLRKEGYSCVLGHIEDSGRFCKVAAVHINSSDSAMNQLWNKKLYVDIELA